MQHRTALHIVFGEAGCTTLIFVLLAAGFGMLLDFSVSGLHPLFSVGMMILGVPAALLWTLRRTLRKMDRKPNPDYVRNLALATVAGQAGCITVVVVFAGLFGGMFLDSRLDTHPVFTIGLVLISVPVSLYAMVRLMLTAVAAIKLDPPPTTQRKPAVRRPWDSEDR